MSFTVKVKEELLGHKSENKMELSAIIKMSGSVVLANHGLNLYITTKMLKLLVIFIAC